MKHAKSLKGASLPIKIARSVYAGFKNEIILYGGFFPP